jgi:peptidyl-prolyl cis-trans isomerase SurA
MKKLQLVLLMTLGITLFSEAQTDDPVVLTIDDENYKVSEFNYIYTKNNKKVSYKKKDLDAYMSLFIDYKLKVKEAKNLGYDTLPRLNNELKQYRGQLSQPYMIDKEKNEALIKEAYDRTINEVRASHILIRVNPEASPEDTLKAYNNIMAIRKRIVEGGEDFATVAKGKNGSQDPSATSNGGDLGYFTALQMVYTFEDAAFNTNIGEVSQPVRTKFGYHIIKVTDKRAAKGTITTKHIMIVSNDKISKEDKVKAESKINEIYELLVNGEKFEDLAIKYSDDKSSSSKGGLLPAFGAGTKQRMVPKFEAAAFELLKDGDYSKPVLTNYGWHIIKRETLSDVPSYEEMYKSLKLKVERDQRAGTTKKSFIENLKKEYSFKENKSLINDLATSVNESILKGEWPKPTKVAKGSEELFSFAGQTKTLNDFVNYLFNSQNREKTQDLTIYLNNKYNKFVDAEITKYEDSILEEKYPSFKTLMQDYQDGILIFEIMQKQIWDKASNDSIGLSNYYNANKAEFVYPTRYKGVLYTCKDKATAKQVLKLIGSDSLTLSDIKSRVNADSDLNLETKSSTFNSETTSEFRKGKKKKLRTFEKGINKPFKYNGSYYIFEVEEVIPPTQREFSDSKGLVTAAYQNKLQEEWLKSLRDKSAIVINKAILYSAKKY